MRTVNTYASTVKATTAPSGSIVVTVDVNQMRKATEKVVAASIVTRVTAVMTVMKMKEIDMQYWTVKIGVSDVWVADGFELDEDTAHELVQHWLSYARYDEISAEVVSAPPKWMVKGLQSGKIKTPESDPDRFDEDGEEYEEDK